VAIGQDLLDLPFAEVVRNLAFAIAEGQLELDRSSIETLRFLIGEEVDIIPEITEVIEPSGRQVTVGPEGSEEIVTITGASIRATGAEPVRLNLLQSGLLPTFYQFTQAEIDVKLSISMKRTETQETEGSRLGLRAGPYGVLAFGSPVNYRTANTYSYSAEGASVLRTTMRPVPPPPRLTPRTVTVNTFTSPPTVTATE
jgi:hypothetical protein